MVPCAISTPPHGNSNLQDHTRIDPRPDVVQHHSRASGNILQFIDRPGLQDIEEPEQDESGNDRPPRKRNEEHRKEVPGDLIDHDGRAVHRAEHVIRRTCRPGADQRDGHKNRAVQEGRQVLHKQLEQHPDDRSRCARRDRHAAAEPALGDEKGYFVECLIHRKIVNIIFTREFH